MVFSNKNKGVLLYTFGMLITVLLNIVIKFITTEYKIPTIEVLFVRQCFLVLFLTPLMVKRKFNFFNKRSLKPNLIRNILFSIGTFLLYSGMAIVPLNDATAITFLTPIIGTILSIKILGEKCSKSIFIAVLLALIGMFIVKRPTFDNKNLFYGYCFLFVCVFIRGYVVVLNKKLTNQFDIFTLLFYTHIIMLLCSFLYFPFFVKFDILALKYIFIACVLFFLEYFILFKAYKYCQATTLQPFEFSKLIFMMFFSSLFLNEPTTLNQIVGGIVIVSGYFFIILKKK